jgi:hypothetical protein
VRREERSSRSSGVQEFRGSGVQGDVGGEIAREMSMIVPYVSFAGCCESGILNSCNSLNSSYSFFYAG